jgi:hypothetical protein
LATETIVLVGGETVVGQVGERIVGMWYPVASGFRDPVLIVVAENVLGDSTIRMALARTWDRVNVAEDTFEAAVVGCECTWTSIVMGPLRSFVRACVARPYAALPASDVSAITRGGGGDVTGYSRD